MSDKESTTRIEKDELEDLARASFEQVGVPSEDAVVCANILVGANLMGIDSHGVKRIPTYVARLRQETLKARPLIKVNNISSSVAIIDGGDGLGPVVAHHGLRQAIQLASSSGIGYVGCRNSNHFGAVSPYLLMACHKKMICLIGTNAFATMAPWGGKGAKVGNNPFSIGAPRRGQFPFILDIAMSVASRGKIRTAAEKKESIPADWATDCNGAPTSDPSEALKGLVLPIGGHKGYGLALAVDILSGVLTGGAFSTQVKSMFQQSCEPQHVGHFFIAINPDRLIGLQNYYDQMDSFCSLIKDTESVLSGKPVLLPGEIEAVKYEERSLRGIPIPDDLCQSLKDLANGVELESGTVL